MMKFKTRIYSIFIFLIIQILSATIFNKQLQAQVSIQRSFYVEDSLDHTPLGFALMEFIKIEDPQHKSHQLRANSRGIIELTGAVSTDSIQFTIHVPGYKTLHGTSRVRNLYLSHISLQSESHTLNAVTVQANTRKIRYKPGEMQIRWNKFSRSPSETIASVIKRIPGIINKSLDKNTLNLETTGNKKLTVFLDGRKLSDQEVQSLPAMMIAKASLVTFPSALDATDNSAVLYLSSNMFAYNYSFDNLNLNYDWGRSGPSFTWQHAQKKGLWSNNIMINGYHYAMPATNTSVDINQSAFQKDSTVSTINSLVLMASLTKKSVKNNLFTIGVYSNLYKGNADGFHTNYGSMGDNGNSFSSQIKSSFINATIYAAWRYKTNKGNIWQLHTSGTFQPKNSFDYNTSNSYGLQSASNTKEQLFSLGAKYALKKTTLGQFDWQNSFTIGTKATHSQTQRSINGQTTSTNAKEKRQEYALYSGVASSISNDKWKIEGSVMGNYGWQNGYRFTQFTNGYIYPKFVFSFAPNDRQSVSLSLSATTLRPSIKMGITDSSYTSNWVISKGNQQIQSEHDYNLDLLYNISIGAFTFEIEGEQVYYNNGIVHGWHIEQNPTVQLISTYQNLDYFDRSISLMSSFQPVDGLYLKWSGSIHRLSFRQADLPKDYKDGYYLNTNLNLNYYDKKLGNFALIGNWDGNPLIYQKRTRTHPKISLSYDYDLSKSFNISAGFYDIFASGQWKRSLIYGGLDQLTNANNRTFSLGLTWKFGQLFGTAAAGSINASSVPNDTKKL